MPVMKPLPNLKLSSLMALSTPCLKKVFLFSTPLPFFTVSAKNVLDFDVRFE